MTEANTISVIWTDEVNDMSVRCRFGKVKPVKDQEIIMKGDQTDIIRRMLDNKQFGIIELPEINGRYPYQVWIMGVSICAIREQGSAAPYEQCTHYLCINEEKSGKEGLKDWAEVIFRYSEMVGPDVEPEMEYPELDSFLAFMEDKELVFGGFYTDSGGDTEAVYRKFFFDINLKLRGNCHRVYDILYDIRFYLTPAVENNQIGLVSEDIRNLDVNSALLEFMKERTNGYCYNNPKDFSLVFEAQSEMAKASYFLRCFYSCHDEDPMGVLCYRFSAYVLPGTVPEGSVKEDKCIVNLKKGTRYQLDQIQINSEKCESVSELKDWIDYDLDSVAED